MAIENVKAFFEALESSPELQAKVNAADAAYTGNAADKAAAAAEILLPIAKEAGFDFTADELFEFEITASEDKDYEFSEDELEAVAGGAICIIIGFGQNKKGGVLCYCKTVGAGVSFLG